jgi:PAS domain S-box-containing protein
LNKSSKAIEQSPTSVVITDLDGLIEYVNPAFTRSTGYTSEECIGRKPNIVKSGKHSIAFYKNIWEKISSGGVWQGNIQNKKKNGELFWEHAIISALVNSDGSISNYIAVKENITEKKLHAEEIQRFKSISENALWGMAIASLDGRLVYINNFFANIHGYTTEELLGKHLSIFHHEKQLKKVDEAIKKMIDTGRFEPIEIWHMDKVGKEFPMLMSGVLLKDDKGQPEYIAASAVDLSNYYKTNIKLIELQSRLVNLSDNLYNGIVYQLCSGTDGSERFFTYISAGIELLRGLTAEEVLKNSNLMYDQIIDEDRNLLVKIEEECISNMSLLRAEYRVQKPTGEIRWMLATSTPVEGKNNQIYWDGIEIDITDLKNREQTILKQNEVLREIAWLQSHVIRKPVANILGLGNLLMSHQNSNNDMQNELFELLLKSVEDFDVVIKTIVDKTYEVNNFD